MQAAAKTLAVYIGRQTGTHGTTFMPEKPHLRASVLKRRSQRRLNSFAWCSILMCNLSSISSKFLRFIITLPHTASKKKGNTYRYLITSSNHCFGPRCIEGMESRTVNQRYSHRRSGVHGSELSEVIDHPLGHGASRFQASSITRTSKPQSKGIAKIRVPIAELHPGFQSTIWIFPSGVRSENGLTMDVGHLLLVLSCQVGHVYEGTEHDDY